MRVLETAAGGVILITNMKTFLEAVEVWIAALVHSVEINRSQRRRTATEGRPA